MDPREVRAKFGDDYIATERTYKMGIDARFTRHMAQRFAGLRVLETCTGAGFTTIALARVAAHVVTVEIDPAHQDQARRNLARAGLLDRVTFVAGDVLDPETLAGCAVYDAAFLDPDWADQGPGHVYRFRDSNTRPPADALLETILVRMRDIALVLPPFVNPDELADLPPHELQALYQDDRHELFCLYFGALARRVGASEYRV